MDRKGKTKAELEIEDRRREQQAVALRARGTTYADIALALGWADKSAAAKAVQRALDRANEGEVGILRQLELARLAELEAEAWAVLKRDHIATNFGKVALYNGKPVLDDGPKLAAIDRLTRLSVQRSKLLGLEAPQRRIVEVISQDLIDNELARYDEEYQELIRGLTDEDVAAIEQHLKKGASS